MSMGYPVGYGKPPKHTQFKPGQSGNPKGRPKNSQTTFTNSLAKILEERISMQTAKGIKKIPIREALARKLIAEALKLNPIALKLLLGLTDQLDLNFSPDLVYYKGSTAAEAMAAIALIEQANADWGFHSPEVK